MFLVERIIILYAIFILLHLSTRRECVAEEYYINKNGMQILQYELHFKPNIKQKTFTSQCTLIVKNDEPVDGFAFYERNLNITSSKLVKLAPHDNEIYRQYDNVKYHSSRSNQEPNHINTHTFSGNHVAGKYSLEFRNINGSLENNLQGFYLDEYPDEGGRKFQFLTTQFAPFGASYAFPSLDEPRFRANFKITIARPKDYTCVISNANLKTSIVKGGLIEDEFEITEKISPCSVAFTISKMEISKKIQDSIHRIVSRPKILTLKIYEYVANLIDRVYKEVENFLQVNCELQNLYHVALPSDRMKFESLGSYRGIIHYKEGVLIFSKNSPVEKQEESTIAIAKLIAQQWFLSYLMLDSWAYAWINEGLTMYLSYHITDKLYPHWKVQERLLIEIRMAMQDDSNCCSKSINREASKPSEIESNFNRKTVYKGTALINMIERIIPTQVFRLGLTNLIKEKKWGTYTSRDVYKEFDAILKLNSSQSFNLTNISTIMSAWESEMGFPLITVKRNYAENFEYVGLSQMRFHFDRTKIHAAWPIPINYATKFNSNFSNTRPIVWLNNFKDTIRIKSLKKTDWLILNNQAAYFYRVNYDDNNWHAIAEALLQNHKNIHYLNRMQIIDDAFSLAEFGMLEYSIPIKISQYIKHEREYAPLKIMKEAFESINKKVAGSEPYDEFQIFIKTSVEYIYDQFFILILADKRGYDSNSTTFHRNHLTLHLLFSWLCDLHSSKCDNNNYKLVDALNFEFMNDLEKHSLCTVMHKATENDWNLLIDKYKKLFSNRKSRMNIFNALGCSEDRVLQERFLNYILKSEKDKLNESFKLTTRHGSDGTNVAIQFISTHFSDILKASVNSDIASILNNIGSRVTTEEELQSLIRLSRKYSKYSDLIKPSLSRAKQNMKWRKKHLRRFQVFVLDKKSIATNQQNLHANILIGMCFTNLLLH